MDTVFAILSDPSRMRDWLPGCQSVGGASLVFKGAWLEVTFREHTATFQITDFQPPYSMAWVEHGARDGSRTSFQLGFAGGTTAIQVKHIAGAQSPPSKVKERRDPRRSLDITLQNLRKLL